jgi:Putative peptidoglycan binding domain
MKKTIIAAIVVSGSLIGVNMSSAQQTAPNKNMPDANPATQVPREINPSNPGQVAPKGPGLDQKIPGQQGTIPEIIQPPGGVTPQAQTPLSPTPQGQMTVTPDEIRRAQEALKTKGYDPGAASGNLHAGTQEALRKYQKANNLPVTGVLDQRTAETLGIEIRKSDSKPSDTKPSDAKSSKDPSKSAPAK